MVKDKMYKGWQIAASTTQARLGLDETRRVVLRKAATTLAYWYNDDSPKICFCKHYLCYII
jgi:hypothetical protein